MSVANAEQCLAILSRHARDEVGPLRLQELCTDTERVNSLVEVHNRSPGAVERYERSTAHLHRLHQQSQQSGGGSGSGGSDTGGGAAAAAARTGAAPAKRYRSATAIQAGESPFYPSVGSIDTSDHSNRLLLVDLSRNRMTVDTVNHLLRLARARDVRGFVRTLAWGWNDRFDPVVPPRSRKGSSNAASSNPSDLRREGSTISGAARHARFAEDVKDGGGRGGTDNNVRGIGSTSLADQSRGGGRTGTGGGGGISSSMRTSPSMHIALRAPAGAGMEMYLPDGTNALDGIHETWDRIMRLSDSIRRGKLRGASGKVLRDVVVVGRGVPVAALRFMYDALRRDPDASLAAREGLTSDHSSIKAVAADGASRLTGRPTSSHKESYSRRLRFVPSVDPAAAVDAISDLKPGSTYVITIVGARGDEETLQASQTLKRWLLAGLGSNRKEDQILDRHMLLVTGDERLARTTKSECTFLMPEYARCEAFTTFTAAALVPLSIVFGWNIVERILAGAHDMDAHFIETNPRHNLPVLLALVDFWNDAFLSSSGKLVTPFTDAFSSYATFLVATQAQTCGQGAGNSGPPGARSAPAMIIDGGKFGNYDRAVYQSGRSFSSELILAMETQASSSAASKCLGAEGTEDAIAAHDDLVCSFFAHADVLALGSTGSREEQGNALGSSTSLGLSSSHSFDATSPRSPLDGSNENEDTADGNRPSTLMICGACDAFTCGQLVALAEHRAAISARLWDVDPFSTFAPSHGTALRMKETERVKEKLHQLYERLARGDFGDDDQEFLSEGTKLNQATSTILWHYANRMRDQKMYVVDGS